MADLNSVSALLRKAEATSDNNNATNHRSDASRRTNSETTPSTGRFVHQRSAAANSAFPAQRLTLGKQREAQSFLEQGNRLLFMMTTQWRSPSSETASEIILEALKSHIDYDKLDKIVQGKMLMKLNDLIVETFTNSLFISQDNPQIKSDPTEPDLLIKYDYYNSLKDPIILRNIKEYMQEANYDFAAHRYLMGIHPRFLEFTFRHHIYDLTLRQLVNFSHLPSQICIRNAMLFLKSYLTHYPAIFREFVATENFQTKFNEKTTLNLEGTVLGNWAPAFKEMSKTSLQKCQRRSQKQILISHRLFSQIHQTALAYNPTIEDFVEAHLKAFETEKRRIESLPLIRPLLNYAEHYLSNHESFEDAIHHFDSFPEEVLFGYYDTENPNHIFTPENFFQIKNDLLERSCQSPLMFDDNGWRNDYEEPLDLKTNTAASFSFEQIKILHHEKTRYLEEKLHKFNATDLKSSDAISLRDHILELLEFNKSLNFYQAVNKKCDLIEIANDLNKLYRMINTLSENEKAAIQKADRKANPKRSTKPKGNAQQRAKARRKAKAAAKKATVKRPLATTHHSPNENPKAEAKPLKSEKAEDFSTPIAMPSAAANSDLPIELEPTIQHELSSIRENVTAQIEIEKAYLKRAENFLLQSTKNADHGVLQALFDPKTNLKSILNLKEMEQITAHLQQRLNPTQEHPAHSRLRGANGVKFRVGDIIDTTHASSAEIGHKGHGGAISDFKDFLLRVFDAYGQAQVVPT